MTSGASSSCSETGTRARDVDIRRWLCGGGELSRGTVVEGFLRKPEAMLPLPLLSLSLWLRFYNHDTGETATQGMP